MKPLEVAHVPVSEPKNPVLELMKLRPPRSAPPKKRKRRAITASCWRVGTKAALGFLKIFSVRQAVMFREVGPGLPRERIEANGFGRKI